VRSFLAFLFQRTQKEEVVAEYIVREHKLGRDLDDVMQDAYVTNRLSKEQALRVLDRPEVVEALGSDAVRSEL
jgi:hypothetical protein